MGVEGDGVKGGMGGYEGGDPEVEEGTEEVRGGEVAGVAWCVVSAQEGGTAK